MKIFVILRLSLTLPVSHPTSDSVFLSVASYEESSCCESASYSPVRKGDLAKKLSKCITEVYLQKLQNRSRYDQPPDCSLTHDPGMVYSDSCLPKKLNNNHLKLIQVPCSVSYHNNLILMSCCCSCSVTKLYPTLCDQTDCSTPGFPVLCSLPELAQVHTHRIGNAV